MNTRKFYLTLLVMTLLGAGIYSCKRLYQDPDDKTQQSASLMSAQMSGYEKETYLIPKWDQQHQIITNIQSLQTDMLESVTGSVNSELDAIFFDPVMISFATTNVELQKRLETDSVSLGYKLMKNSKGTFYAMPFPVIIRTEQPIRLMGCDNCNGCEEANCGGGSTFCYKNLVPNHDTLSGDPKVTGPDIPVKHTLTTRNIFKKPVTLGMFSYTTVYDKTPVTVTIEYRLAGITDNEPQHRPSGKWCGCCIGTYCWAWWTTDLNADCSDLCKKLNIVYDRMKD